MKRRRDATSLQNKKEKPNSQFLFCGEDEIRTRGTVARTSV